MTDDVREPVSSGETPKPVLELVGVHARDAAGRDGRARGSLAGVSLSLGRGVHAIVGAPEHGSLALFDAITGARAVVRGRVSVLGQDPRRSAAARAHLGSLAPEPRLPQARTVRDAVHLATDARGQTGDHFDAIAADLGLASLAGRPPPSLSFSEERAVELALALSTPEPTLLVLHEPLADVASARAEILAAQLGDAAARGACVIVTTSSWADARRLGDHQLVLDRGLIFVEGDHQTPAAGLIAPEPRARDVAAPVVLRAWVRGEDTARQLAAALLQEPSIRGVEFQAAPHGRLERASAGAEAQRIALLEVRGAGVEPCSLALLDAAAALDAEVVALREVTLCQAMTEARFGR